MACNRGHLDCIGPECTKANVPNRPLIGVARERAANMAAIKECLRGCTCAPSIKEKRSALEIRFWASYDAFQALRAINTLHGSSQFKDWLIHISYKGSRTSQIMRVSISHIKENQ